MTVLTGCAVKTLSPEEIKKLQGGYTTVVVYGFCVPADYLFQGTLTRGTLTYVVNDKKIGTMKTCSYATFRVPSGYWESRFDTGWIPHRVLKSKFRPGATQYLHMRPAGNGNFRGLWVDKAKADAGIAEIKKIGQVF